MDTWKLIRFSDKFHKKELLLSYSRYKVFKEFLLQQLGSKILVINSNNGCMVFYDTPFNNSELIKDAFYSIGKPSLSRVIIVQNFETHEQAKKFYQSEIRRIYRMPQHFLAYTKSMFGVFKSPIEAASIPLAETIVRTFLEIVKDYKTPDTSNNVLIFLRNVLFEFDSKLHQELLNEAFSDVKRN